MSNTVLDLAADILDLLRYHFRGTGLCSFQHQTAHQQCLTGGGFLLGHESALEHDAEFHKRQLLILAHQQP